MQVVFDRGRVTEFQCIGDQRMANRHFAHAGHRLEKFSEVVAVQVMACVNTQTDSVRSQRGLGKVA